MPNGSATVASAKFVMAPPGVTRPIEPGRLPPLPRLVNQRFPSGPATIWVGVWTPLPMNTVTSPVGVMRPIERSPLLANHRLPSGPGAMPVGYDNGLVTKFENTPAGVTRPIEPPLRLVNHRLPSGPVVIEFGPLTLG